MHYHYRCGGGRIGAQARDVVCDDAVFFLISTYAQKDSKNLLSIGFCSFSRASCLLALKKEGKVMDDGLELILKSRGGRLSSGRFLAFVTTWTALKQAPDSSAETTDVPRRALKEGDP